MIISLIWWSWFVYNKFLYDVAVEDIPDSYFTYTGDIYTWTKEDNGFYKMKEYFADPKNEQILNSLEDLQGINLSTWNNKYPDRKKDFINLYLTWEISTWQVYIQPLNLVEKDINYVLYSWFNLYNILYGSWWQLSLYDKLIADFEIINNLPWQYDSDNIENYMYGYWSIFSPTRDWLLIISILSCYLKDYDRCYKYRSQTYQLSRNLLYSKPWPMPFEMYTIDYSTTLKVADFLIQNNMVDDVIYKKMLADLNWWNIYTIDQLLHNTKVSAYNYFKYLIYNVEDAESRLWYTLWSPFLDYQSYSFKTKLFFDKDLTHLWLKNILKYDNRISKYITAYGLDTFSFLVNSLFTNPRFNNYGIALLSKVSPRWSSEYYSINNRLSYRDKLLQKYQNYTPTIIREEIITGSDVNLSWSQNILSWIVLEGNNLTWDIDSSDVKKDFAYCQQFKNKISLYMKCIKSIE